HREGGAVRPLRRRGVRGRAAGDELRGRAARRRAHPRPGREAPVPVRGEDLPRDRQRRRRHDRRQRDADAQRADPRRRREAVPSEERGPQPRCGLTAVPRRSRPDRCVANRLCLMCRSRLAMMEADSAEASIMRIVSVLSMSLVLTITTFAFGADEPRLKLMDEELSIQELRPLERHVWVLTLEGKWGTPAKPGVKHYVNVIFPNGASASHRVLSEDYAANAQFPVLIQDPDLVRNQVPRGAKLTVVISADKAVTAADAPEVISEPFVTPWPLDRPIV